MEKKSTKKKVASKRKAKKPSAKTAKETSKKEFTLSIYDLSGTEIGKVDLDKKIFNGKVNLPLLYQVSVMYEANKRQGTAETKTRAMVSGGNSKPWRQKGTGRARIGSSRSPLWRKGGIVFGPHKRDYSYQVPKKIKRGALISSLNSRLSDNLIKVLDELKVDSGKTKEFVKIINSLKLERKTLFVCDKPEALLIRSTKNIQAVILKRWETINALDVLKHDNLVITKKALESLTKHLKKGV